MLCPSFPGEDVDAWEARYRAEAARPYAGGDRTPIGQTDLAEQVEDPPPDRRYDWIHRREGSLADTRPPTAHSL